MITRIKLTTNYINEKYTFSDYIDLSKIIDDEGIIVHYDDYENAFDGIFIIDNNLHHIHLNKTRGNFPDSGRGRFSLAHELGHFLLEEHYNDIFIGKLQPHPSFQRTDQQSAYEKEADYFAANLLMPEKKFYDLCNGREFCWALIEDLANKFKTSRLATLLRFISTIRHEIFIIISENGIIKWFLKSEDFPKMKHKFKRLEKLPHNALANKKIIDTTNIVESDTNDWFCMWDGQSDRQLYEQCYYAAAYQQIITLLWYK